MANQRLPGLEDARIEELETLAEDYKKWQKKRMSALAKEVEIKDKIMGVLKGQKKKHYRYEDLEIEIIATKEKLKIKGVKDDEDEAGEE